MFKLPHAVDEHMEEHLGVYSPGLLAYFGFLKNRKKTRGRNSGYDSHELTLVAVVQSEQQTSTSSLFATYCDGLM